MSDVQELGASLYVPTTRDDLHQIARGERLCELRSVIFCTEDAVKARDLPNALENLRGVVVRHDPRASADTLCPGTKPGM